VETSSDGPVTADAVAAVWRRQAPHVLGALVRRYGDFAGCEDAVAEAMIAAATQWPVDGLPDAPRAWLIRVAARRYVDAMRRDRARAARERRDLVGIADDARHAPPADAAATSDDDDTLRVFFLCAHPDLPRPSQVALTLRAVGGLTTEQIAAGFLVPTATMAKRITRAKRVLADRPITFADESGDVAEEPQRLNAVMQVLYLVFNEGYVASAGDRLVDVSLTAEAIRLTRELRRRLPDHAEVSGLLALMLLTAARTAARTDGHGDLVPLAEQDRSRWDQAMIAEGIALVERALPVGDVGPFQLQAAIAAVHAEAATAAATDWSQITVLYRMLDRVAPSPTVTLNLAVAVGMAHGPAAGLDVVERLRDHPAMKRHHRLHAVRGHLLEMIGRTDEARAEFAAAARLTSSVPEQRYLNAQAGLAGGDRGRRAPDRPR